MDEKEFNEKIKELLHLLEIFNRLNDKGEKRQYRGYIRQLIVEMTIV